MYNAVDEEQLLSTDVPIRTASVAFRSDCTSLWSSIPVWKG